MRMVAGIMQELIPNSLVNYTDYQKKSLIINTFQKQIGQLAVKFGIIGEIFFFKSILAKILSRNRAYNISFHPRQPLVLSAPCFPVSGFESYYLISAPG